MTTIVADAAAGSVAHHKKSLWDALAQVVEWVIPFSLVTIIIVGPGWVVFAAQ